MKKIILIEGDSLGDLHLTTVATNTGTEEGSKQERERALPSPPLTSRFPRKPGPWFPDTHQGHWRRWGGGLVLITNCMLRHCASACFPVRVRICVREREWARERERERGDVEQGAVAFCNGEKAFVSHQSHLLSIKSICSDANDTLQDMSHASSLYAACSLYHFHCISCTHTDPHIMATDVEKVIDRWEGLSKTTCAIK